MMGYFGYFNSKVNYNFRNMPSEKTIIKRKLDKIIELLKDLQNQKTINEQCDKPKVPIPNGPIYE